ncbi:unnamed protein product, partial [Mesorhabditis spiculigera]
MAAPEDQQLEEELNLSQASGDMDQDFEDIERQMAEIEEEQKKLQDLQGEVTADLMNISSSSQNGSVSGFPPTLTPEEKAELDARSVYVGNVDYGCTAEELKAHFHGCGSVSRVTILCDNFAYVEFSDQDGVKNALQMDESLLRGRQIKVCQKRTNKPGISSTNRPPRSRGRGRGVIVKYIYPGGGYRGRGRGMRRRSNFMNIA